VTVATLLGNADIVRACVRHGVRKLRVFGSVLTDQFDASTSDVDLTPPACRSSVTAVDRQSNARRLEATSEKLRSGQFGRD
jgi:predicted nucleotidyltransferase